MYVGSERSIAKWDMLELMSGNGEKDGYESGCGVQIGTKWGTEVFDEGGEWA